MWQLESGHLTCFLPALSGTAACGHRYVFSHDVAKALVETHGIAPLKFMPNEDATFGFWVMGMNLRRVDHPRAKTPAGHCCWG